MSKQEAKLRDYTSIISSLPRPYLKHEHPGVKDYLQGISQHFKYFRFYFRPKYENKSLLDKLLKHAVEFNSEVKLEEINYLNNKTNRSYLFEHLALVSSYLLEAWLKVYSTKDKTRAYYPGWHAEQGIKSDAIEGTSRILPLIANVLYFLKHHPSDLSQEELQLLNGVQEKEQLLKDAFISAIVNGTNPKSKSYWGDLQDYSQLICETHDIALSVWLTREEIFHDLPTDQRLQILAWFKQVSNVNIVDNNWHLFILLVQLVAADLESPIQSRYGYVKLNDLDNLAHTRVSKDLTRYFTKQILQDVPVVKYESPQANLKSSQEELETIEEKGYNSAFIYPSGWQDNAAFYQEFLDLTHVRRTCDFYTSKGWWRDGANGDYDFYNSWGFTYSLYWIEQIDPSLFGKVIGLIRQQQAQQLLPFFTPTGVVLYGRSIPYRLASSCSILAALDNKQSILGTALKAFLAPNCSFIAQGAIRNGLVTSGLYHKDRRLVDPYSGPASAFWSLRSYCLLWHQATKLPLFRVNFTPLPVEQGDFTYQLPTIGAVLTGKQQTLEVVLQFTHNKYTFNPLTSRLQEQGNGIKFLEWLVARSLRPKNNLLRKGVTTWSSRLFHYL